MMATAALGHAAVIDHGDAIFAFDCDNAIAVQHFIDIDTFRSNLLTGFGSTITGIINVGVLYVMFEDFIGHLHCSSTVFSVLFR